MRRIFLLVACVLGFLAGRSFAAEEGSAVKAEIFVDRAAVKMGEPFEIAVVLTPNPGWHIYWKNPGDAGMATEFKVEKAAGGIDVGEAEFPVPRKFLMAGGITDYGYEGKTVFLMKGNLAKDAIVGKEVRLEIKASWLCCSDKVCVPGGTKLSLTIPVATDGAAVLANQELFEKARAAMPAEGVKGTGAEMIAFAARGGGGLPATFSVAVQWKGEVKDVDLYPTAVDGLEVANIRVATEKDRTGITFEGRVLAGQSLKVEKMPVLVVYTDKDGKRRGFFADVDLHILMPGAIK